MLRRMVLLIALVLLMAAILSASAVTALAGEIACTWEQDYETGEETWVCYEFDY